RLFLACFAIFVCALMSVAATSRAAQSFHEIYRTGISHPQRYFAETTHDGTGRPVVIYYHRYSTALAYFQSFIRAHERCHVSGYHNEVAASCCALNRLGSSRSQRAAIGNYIVSRDVNPETVVDYQGQGRLFWSKIEARCLGSASR
ncbi:MAG: hypothetical protein ACM3MH_07075, partial [Actinomycetota bacterium]